MKEIDLTALFTLEGPETETKEQLYAMMREFKEKYPQVDMLELIPMFHLLVLRIIEMDDEYKKHLN